MTAEHNRDDQADIPVPAPMEEPARNVPLLIALVAAGLEALVLLAAAAWSVVTIASDNVPDVAVAVALTVVLLLFALLLLAGINALWQGRRWGRGPVLTWQLIQAAIAVGAIGMAPGWAVFPALIAAVVIAVGLLLPSSVAATGRTSSNGTVL
ncbi:MAG: hypothetical protein ACK5H2_00035 [Beutenbergiaceae bacterium]